jgi:glutaredoxin
MKTLGVLCLSFGMALTAAAQGQAQSLAELAKVEKQRQTKARAAGGPAKEYTGEVKSEPAPTSGAAAQPADSPRAKPASSPIPGPRAPEGARHDTRSLRDVNVIIYVTSWCQYCRKARAFLASQPNVRVVTHDIEENRARNAEMLAKTGGEKGIPVLDVEGRILQGFSASAITEALASARSVR